MQNLRVVLVRPGHPGNLGSVARLAANFGVDDVVLVAPRCSLEHADARRMACNMSISILAHMRAVDTLSEALATCTYAVGFSRRQGDLRDSPVPLTDLPGLQTSGKLALVFGPEEGGLETDDLLLCSHTAAIPSHARMPSLNLSHAVGVILARLFEAHAVSTEQGLPNSPAKFVRKATLHEFEGLIGQLQATLEQASDVAPEACSRMGALMRRALQRAALDEREVQVFRGFLSRVQGKLLP